MGFLDLCGLCSEVHVLVLVPLLETISSRKVRIQCLIDVLHLQVKLFFCFFLEMLLHPSVEILGE